MKTLEDVRIIALEQYGAGPFGSVHLADLGAEVIKIEDPRTKGDVGRYVPPFQAVRTVYFLRPLIEIRRASRSTSQSQVAEECLKTWSA